MTQTAGFRMFHRIVVWIWISFIISWISYGADADQPCVTRKYNHPSYVCVCNATYCDEISKIETLREGNYIAYVSSLEGDRFKKHIGFMNKSEPEKIEPNGNDVNNWFNFFPFGNKVSENVSLIIMRNKTYQTIHGFGGAFTDATGINLEKLTQETQDKLLNSYFSENGIEYNIGRVPIGGTDFSTFPYTYNMEPENDLSLSNFSLTMEDYNYKIPLIKKARTLATDKLYLVSSAWSPPVWMKTNKAYGGFSNLLKEYYQTWADYHLRFFEEYDKNDVQFWSVTTGNEPFNGIIPLKMFNSLGWMPGEQAIWLAENFGPTIKGSRFSYLNIIALDDQRFALPWWIEWMSANENASNYIDGIATHWYWDDYFPINGIEHVHETFPDKFLISTEACVGDKPWEFEKVELGSWTRAEMYIRNIIQVLNHWYTGWIDWNLALNSQGGPNWSDNFVDAPIITMPENDEFVKQPMFYGIGHFSKFIPRGSKRVSLDRVGDGIDSVAFLRPDGGIAVVFYNPSDSKKNVTIQEEGKGFLKIDVGPRSVHSVIYW